MKQDFQKTLDLLDDYGLQLHSLIGRITRCEHTTSDLMQELFMSLARSDGFAKASDPYAYAWRTAVNLALEAGEESEKSS